MSSYTTPSQIAQRQLAFFSGKRVLVAGEAEDLFPVELKQHCESVSVFTTNYGYYRQINRDEEINCIFDSRLKGEVDADMVLLYWPKAKAEAEYLLAMLLAKLGTGTEVVVVGENRSGVKSIEKMFKPYGKVIKHDSARRCSFYWGECVNQPDTFDQSEWFKTYTLNVNEHTVTVKSLPGVFSHGQFDVGSQLLIDNLPELQGKILDFGCGAGVIGSVLGMINPDIELKMCDISALAIESSRNTLEVNGVTGEVFASDVYSDTQAGYDFIISNPPFHAGLDTSYSATETLLKDASEHLSSAGQLYIVANSFLKYPPIIEAQFGHCNTVSKTNKFAIYHAGK